MFPTLHLDPIYHLLDHASVNIEARAHQWKKGLSDANILQIDLGQMT